jgi:hypothetical protein
MFNNFIFFMCMDESEKLSYDYVNWILFGYAEGFLNRSMLGAHRIHV